MMRGICACSLAAGTTVGSVLGHKWSQLIGPRYLRLAASGRTSALHRGGRNPGGDPGTSLSVQVEASSRPTRALSRVPTSLPPAGPNRAAEPMRTPPKRAPYRSGLAGTVRDRPETRQFAGHITMSDRAVRGERAPSRLMAPRRPADVHAHGAPDEGICVP